LFSISRVLDSTWRRRTMLLCISVEQPMMVRCASSDASSILCSRGGVVHLLGRLDTKLTWCTASCLFMHMLLSATSCNPELTINKQEIQARSGASSVGQEPSVVQTWDVVGTEANRKQLDKPGSRGTLLYRHLISRSF
jgi:hypothetical protein